MIQNYKQARLLPLLRECLQCHIMTSMTATGKLYYDIRLDKWLIEYWCPKDQELFRIWSADRDALTREIAQEFVLDDLPTVH